MTHADRIRARESVIAFAAGATVCIGATAAVTALFLSFATKRGIS